jgi:hypothetical protein
VKAKEFANAKELLDMVKDWVIELQIQGDDMHQLCAELQRSVECSGTRGQQLDSSSTCELSDVFLAKDSLKPLDSPRSSLTSTEYQSSVGDNESTDDGSQLAEEEQMVEPSDISSLLEESDTVHIPFTGTSLQDSSTSEPEAVVSEALAHVVHWQAAGEEIRNLLRMQDHISCIVNFPTSSAALQKRMELRLEEYGKYWESLEGIWSQHSKDFQIT